jgi:hypothetical protein
MIRPEKWLAASALALEAAAVAFLHGAPAGAEVRALAALLAHALGAASAAAFLSRRADRLLLAGSTGRGAWLLFVITSFALPLVGPAALAALFAWVARGHAHPGAALVRAPLSGVAAAAPLPAEIATEIGLGSLEARLRFDPASASRIAAVLATRRLHGAADATRLLRLALRDRHEDVRLLAHALLEDRDRQAFQRIEELERDLVTTTSERVGASVACLLAEALFDLCDFGLVSGELESFTLRRARSLLEQTPAPETAGASLLLARVLLRQGDARGARAAIDESGRRGAPPALLAPLAAEAAFREARA